MYKQPFLIARSKTKSTSNVTTMYLNQRLPVAPIYTIWPKCKNHFLPLFHLILKFPRPSLPVFFSMDWAVGVVNELNRKLLDYPQAESKEHLDLFRSLCKVMEPQRKGFYFLPTNYLDCILYVLRMLKHTFSRPAV